MGQMEVMEIVKANKGRKLTINEIKEEYKKKYNKNMNPNSNSVSLSLSKLRKFGLLKYSSENGRYGNDIYRYWL